jgi:hypothetical protein
MRQAISNDPNSGTSPSQDDDAMSFASRLDPFAVYWAEETRHEQRFSEWLEKQDQRDIDRLARVAAVTKSIAQDRARVERAVLIDRGVYRGRR